MTFNVSEYTPNIVMPNYNKTDYSLNLEMAVLAKKNTEQENALRTISGLQNSALNISMLNREGKERLDAYNKELGSQLSGDLGDLTKIESQNKVANLFQKISTDKELINASRMSRQYMEEYETINQLKQSGRKDSGYSEINEYVWMNWEGGYNDFASRGLGEVNSPNFQMSKYVPHKDLRQPLANLAKLLHEDITSRESQVTDEKGVPTGYLTKNTYGGISPERVRALYEEQLGQDGITQLEVLSKYEILKHRNQGTIENLYNQYEAVSKSNLQTSQNRLKEYEQGLALKQEQLKKADITPEEKTSLLNEVNQYQTGINTYKANIQNGQIKDRSDFMKMSNSELLPYAYLLQKEEKINNAVNAFSWKKDLQELSPDATYLAAKKIDAMMAQTRIREEGAMNRLKLSHTLKAQSDAEKEAKDKSAIWSDGDIGKNEQELISGYDKLVGLQDQYAKMTDNIITAPSFDSSSLKGDKYKSFYEKNKDNYYVQMWDVFKNTSGVAYDSNGNPNIQAFNLWVESEENNPSSFSRDKVQAHKNNSYVHDYLTGELGKVDGALRSQMAESKLLLPYARDENGNQIKEEDLYSGKEIFIYVPTSPKGSGEYRGGYQKKPLKDLLYDLEHEVVKGSSIAYNSVTGQPYSTSINNTYSSYLDNDPGLKQVLQAYQAKSQDPVTKKFLMDKLPQWQQFGYSQTSDKNEIARYQGQISASAKNVSDNSRALFGVEAIEAIAIPKGAGDKGIVKFKMEYADKLKAAQIQLPTADGNVYEVVKPGRGYLFDTQPIQARDVLFNMAIGEKPYTGKLKGWNYEIKTMMNGTQAVVLTKPDGTKIQPQMSIAGKDANEVISNIEAFINNQTK